ncbi:hypothetical protein nbrc107696_33250 [Gordonia spumicola]|uniref:Tetratricopeptide repeat protein n=1 Tax=Gordonia spumicola TaxID=589161 RepID=A0A7I9VBY2_9ACTN|nr:hypothetical protein [Gordonia spumicola]GEE02879.1 hypothetical protein nbrc107696_33250 [Gordonia spumicola]
MTTPETDRTMTAMTDAVMRGRTGDVDGARADLLSIWAGIGPTGDAFHRCTLAHYLADLYPDPALSLVWNVRALDAADALTDQRVAEHTTGVTVAGFYPSLHLNLADDLRRLASFDAAREHLSAARAASPELGSDGYGTMIRRAIDEVGVAVDARDTAPRPSAPGPS